jgi:hypothetical protein
MRQAGRLVRAAALQGNRCGSGPAGGNGECSEEKR